MENKIAGVIPLVITTGIAMNVYERTLGTKKKSNIASKNKIIDFRKISYSKKKSW